MTATISRSRMRRHAPFEPTDRNICMWGGVADVGLINRAIFLKIRQRVSELSDPGKRHFPLKSSIALTTVSELPCRTVIMHDVQTTGHGSWVMWVMGQLCDGSHMGHGSRKMTQIPSLLLHCGP